MPVKVDITPRPPANSKQLGVTGSILYSGSKFQGFQRSKGNSYEVEVVLQVCTLMFAIYVLYVSCTLHKFIVFILILPIYKIALIAFVQMYLC